MTGCPALFYPAIPGGIIGHRGASGVAPENTLPAWAEARAQGARWVECDVVLSADGIPVLFHDDTLDRTTDGHGPLADQPLAALRRLDAGGWFHPRFAGTPLPTLAEALAAAVHLGLGVNVELKPDPRRGPNLVAAVAALIAPPVAPPVAGNTAPPGGSTAGPPILLSSFDPALLAEAATRCPDHPRALLVEAETEAGVRAVANPTDAATLVRRARALGCCGLHLEDRLVTAAHIGMARANGMGISVWTVNDPRRAAVLWDLGVGAIITDHPARLLRHRSPSP